MLFVHTDQSWPCARQGVGYLSLGSGQWSHPSLLQGQWHALGVYQKGLFPGIRWKAFFQNLAGQYSTKQYLIMVGEDSGPCGSGDLSATCTAAIIIRNIYSENL